MTTSLHQAHHPADSRSLWSRHGVDTSNALYGAFYSDSPDGDTVPGQRDGVTWFTTNAEYGGFHQHKHIIEGDVTEGKGSPSNSKVGSRGSQRKLSSKCGDNNHDNKTPDAGSRAGVHLPPIDRGYMVASRPCLAPTVPQIHDARAARVNLQTGAGKRFIRNECPRLWDNLQHVGLTSSGHMSRDNQSDVLTVTRDDIIEEMEEANAAPEDPHSENTSGHASPDCAVGM